MVVAVVALDGGSSAHKGSSALAATHHARGTHAGAAHTKHTHAAAGASRARLSVAVLNGTETTGLAHRISGQLQQSGYAHASALNGRPPGANEVTVVQYANGHKRDAESVAHTLGVSQVQPLEATVASFAGAASVAVIAGLDKAAAGT